MLKFIYFTLTSLCTANPFAADGKPTIVSREPQRIGIKRR